VLSRSRWKVQDQVELELEPAHVVEAGLGEVLSDMITA
jgi:hypothetical protein